MTHHAHLLRAPTFGAPLGALLGAMLAAAAVGCDPPQHESVAFGGEDGTCDDCHMQAYDRSAFDHRSVGYDIRCAECHVETTWDPIFEPQHDRFFELLGRHAEQQCRSCHAPDRADPQPISCVGCHAADRAGAVPDHGGFSVDCQGCHTTTAWQPASFGDHDDWWPLRGQHARTACGDCHIDDIYEGTPRACVGCHQADRDRALPDHADFPRDCAECHTEVAWRPAAFAHDDLFPIEGAHLQNACQDCHIGERYAGTPRTCAGCHADDRDAAQPTHARFSDACTECHTQVAFSPATHRHRQFRVPHEGVSRCLDCHTDPQDYRNVGCTSCHEHRRSEVDPEHRGIPDYRYADAACLDCHPQGND